MDLVTFTEDSLNEKLLLFCSVTFKKACGIYAAIQNIHIGVLVLSSTYRLSLAGFPNNSEVEVPVNKFKYLEKENLKK